jgi:hypothetical protein
VSKYLHTLSGILFYVLAGSFFLAFALVRNGLGGDLPGFWLHIGDLPLALSGLVYGGTSMYLSLRAPSAPSRGLAMGIAVPLAVLFALVLVASFGNLAAWF